jgi:hypothetical protein
LLPLGSIYTNKIHTLVQIVGIYWSGWYLVVPIHALQSYSLIPYMPKAFKWFIFCRLSIYFFLVTRIKSCHHDLVSVIYISPCIFILLLLLLLLLLVLLFFTAIGFSPGGSSPYTSTHTIQMFSPGGSSPYTSTHNTNGHISIHRNNNKIQTIHNYKTKYIH